MDVDLELIYEVEEINGWSMHQEWNLDIPGLLNYLAMLEKLKNIRRFAVYRPEEGIWVNWLWK